jgi:Uma2 family endonuclease
MISELTARAPVPMAEYLRTSYRPDREYIDGIIEERNLGEYDHANLQAALVVWFRTRQREWNIRAVPELRVQVSPTRFRVPDVTVIDRAQPVEQILTHPPLVVVEVLSPEDTWRRMEERIADYLRFGIPNVWVLEPQSRRAWAITPEGRQESTDTLGVTGSPITVALDELFKELES